MSRGVRGRRPRRRAVDYLDAWELQRRVHAEVVDGERPDTVLLLEHPPTYTAGKRTEPHERPADTGGAPVIDVDRGGKITFHGPGQIVAYPIVRLPEHVLVVDFVRRLEEAMIATCRDLGVEHRPRSRAAAASGSGPTRVRPESARSAPSACGSAAGRDDARHRPQLRRRPRLVRPLRARAASPTPASPRSSQELGRDVTVTEVLPVLQRRLAELLAWEPYDATPDYEPRPDPSQRAACRGPELPVAGA